MYTLYAMQFVYNSFTIIDCALCLIRELWQGRRWLSEPQYHSSSATIMDREVYPHNFVSVLHVDHGIVLGRIKFFIEVCMVNSCLCPAWSHQVCSI